MIWTGYEKKFVHQVFPAVYMFPIDCPDLMQKNAIYTCFEDSRLIHFTQTPRLPLNHLTPVNIPVITPFQSLQS